MPWNHVILNNYEKLELLKEYKKIQTSGDHVSLVELVDWAKEKFQLQKKPSKQTISSIFWNETKIRNELDKSTFKIQRGTSVKFPNFETLLVKWVREMFDKNVCVIDE